MLKNLLTMLALGLFAGCVREAKAQQLFTNVIALPGGGEQITISTNPNPTTAAMTAPSVWGGLNEIASAVGASGLLQATNYSFEPYLTYAPKLPTKYGGGVLVVYNMNKFVGLGIGADYLGQLSLVSVNATLKVPIAVGQYYPSSWPLASTLTNVIVTPFALQGVATPMSGTTGGTAITIEDTGGYIQFGHLLGGRFNTGVAYGQWNNAGIYSGKRYHIFAGWSKGF